MRLRLVSFAPICQIFPGWNRRTRRPVPIYIRLGGNELLEWAMSPILRWSGVIVAALLALEVLGSRNTYFTSETIIAQSYVPQVAALDGAARTPSRA
jgi:hypothetical protein